MKKRRIYLVILVAIIITISILCGTVVAYMFRQTEYEENHFTPAEISCKVLETFDGVNKTSIQVQNTGNIDSYLRVKLITYWVDTEGNIVAKPSENLEIDLASGWIKGTNNTYYYKKPVAPDNLTGNLLSESISLNVDNGYFQVIEVFAEAIQSKPEDAVISSWGVTVDSDGNITAAK